MERNLKLLLIKGGVLVGVLLGVTFLFRFPIDYFHLELLRMNEATRLFSKSDALKVLALAILFFALYYRERIARVKHEKQDFWVSSAFISGGFLFVVAYYALRYLANLHGITSGWQLLLVMLASAFSLALSFSCFAVGVFSWPYLRRLYASFRKELWVACALSVLAYALLMLFQGLWPLFSYAISRLLFVMFSPFYATHLEFDASPVLTVDSFTVSIGPPCSGIESLFLFAAFSLGVYALDHRRLKKGWFLFSSLLGLVGIYFVNVARLFLLVLTGIYVSPSFAVGMFHTNVGWILFAIYFMIYYYIITKFIYLPAPSGRRR